MRSKIGILNFLKVETPDQKEDGEKGREVNKRTLSELFPFNLWLHDYNFGGSHVDT